MQKKPTTKITIVALILALIVSVFSLTGCNSALELKTDITTAAASLALKAEGTFTVELTSPKDATVVLDLALTGQGNITSYQIGSGTLTTVMPGAKPTGIEVELVKNEKKAITVTVISATGATASSKISLVVTGKEKDSGKAIVVKMDKNQVITFTD